MTTSITTEPIALRDDERQRCEIWTRVMGYHRPVAAFNPGKKGEYAERVDFRAPADLEPARASTAAAAA